MNRHPVFVLSCVGFWLIAAVGPVAQTSKMPKAGSASAAAQVPGEKKPRPGVTDFTPPEERQNKSIEELQAAVTQLQSEVASLRAQLSNPGASPRTPVALTPDSEYPTGGQHPTGGQKADDFQQLSNAIQNLWTAIDLLKKDIRTLNGAR